MAIKGPELEIGIKANVDQVKTDLGTLATTLERIKKASDLRIDLDVSKTGEGENCKACQRHQEGNSGHQLYSSQVY